MPRLFDKKEVMDINMMLWEGKGFDGHDTNVTSKYFLIELLPYNEVLDAYEVNDVEVYVKIAEDWEHCRGDFANEEDPNSDRFIMGKVDKKSTRFLVYMREKTIDSLMQTYVYNEKANHCPQEKVEQFNKMLRSFLEERMLDELEGSRRDWLHDTVAQMWSDFCDKEENKMGLYAPDNYCWLYKAEGNGMNFLVLEEEYRRRHIIFDWDVSQEEVNAIVQKFLGAGLTEDDFQSDAKWEEGDFREKHGFISYDVLA